MEKKYDHETIEKKWQKYWEDNKTFNVTEDPNKEKFYGLIEFPYPSGDGIHMGHVRTDTAMDVITRKRRMQGYNVLYPIGWDAFGLPTENYAIKTGIHPTIVTKNNITTFTRQLKSIGFSFDWSREINTTDPAYYKWTQWIFLKFFEKGLAYKKKMLINWCPKDKIGLANEEVVDGCCERCGTPVEKREKEQWMLAITKYAERLDKDLDDVNYLEKIKTQQRNWIGKSEGAEIEFQIKDNDKKIKVFTTRPDTLFGVTYVVIAPESELIDQLKSQIVNFDEVVEYIKEIKNRPDIERTAEGKEKTGIELKGIKATNPVNQEEVPVFIADYVLAHYGTGAVMAVPAHDTRDFAFAKKYNLPIKEVIEPTFEQMTEPGKVKVGEPFNHREAIIAIVKHWSEDKYIGLKWKEVDWGTFITGGIEEGQTPEEAGRMEIEQETGYKNIKFIKDFGIIHGKFYHVPKKVNRNAHAHVLYFELAGGERNEMAEEEKAIHDVEWHTVEELRKFLTPTTHLHGLQWLLGENGPYTDLGTLTNSGKFNRMESSDVKKAITEFAGGKIVTTFKLRDWIFSRQHYWGEPIPVVLCSTCGIVPVPEKDLPVKLPMVEKYLPTDTGESPLALITDWVNVKCPKCGEDAKRETDTMPNWAGSSWYYLRYTDAANTEQFASAENLKYWLPVDWYNGGMEHTTLHLLYSRFWHKFLYDLKLVPTNEPYFKRTSQGFVLGEDGEKMSKSRGNVVNPDEIVKNVGADSLRVYEMFMGPFDQSIAWSSNNIVGSRRFLEKVWKLQEKVVDDFSDSENVILVLNQTIKKVGEDIENIGFNTAISSMMILANTLEGQEKISERTFTDFVKILSPFAPHISEELWSNFGGEKSITKESWPQYDASKLTSQNVKIVVQINGKVRGTIDILADSPENVVEKIALENKDIVKWIEGKQITKRIFVKNKIINFVV